MIKIKCGACENESTPIDEGCGLLKCSLCMNINILESNQDITVREWVQFNYIEYLEQVLRVTQGDSYDLVRATNAVEMAAGKLDIDQIDKLRTVLVEGFQQDQTLREIANRIESDVAPKDLFRIRNGQIEKDVSGIPKLQIGKDFRSIQIARTETVRLSNLGAIAHFKEQGVQEVTFIATLSDRTCPACEELNGIKFNINETVGLIPVHVGCRCSWLNLLS